jgi:hypothetical protein
MPFLRPRHSGTWQIGCCPSHVVNLQSIRPETDRVLSAKAQIGISIEVKNCPVWGYCSDVPQLVFDLINTDDDTSNYTIYVMVGKKIYEYPGDSARMDVRETSSSGVSVTYWAESNTTAVTLHESSFHMKFIPSGNRYLFELLGDQWIDQIPGGALVWEMFPLSELSDDGWAQIITDPNDLNTSVDYALLAGRLIWGGIVTPGSCPNRGLLANGAADTCGLEAAHDQVVEWQNKNNEDIMQAALTAHVPARLLKGVIGQESQFYPKWNLPEEYGLGMLTQRGVDMLLQWNEDYYMNKCSMIFGPRIVEMVI